jgi:hypothetical protein
MLIRSEQVSSKSGVAASLVAELLVECADDPVAFNDHVLGRPPYWPGQERIARALVAHQTVLAVTGNDLGKSYLAAGLILWWVYTRPDALVIATAPSQTLLGSVVFKEIRRALRRSKVPLPGTITDSPAPARRRSRSTPPAGTSSASRRGGSNGSPASMRPTCSWWSMRPRASRRRSGKRSTARTR